MIINWTASTNDSKWDNSNNAQFNAGVLDVALRNATNHGNWATCRTLNSFSSGKHEIMVDITYSASNVAVGVCDSNFPLYNSCIGASNNGGNCWGYYSQNLYHNNTLLGTFPTGLATGSRVLIKLNFDEKSIDIQLLNSNGAFRFTNLTNSVYVAVSFTHQGSSARLYVKGGDKKEVKEQNSTALLIEPRGFENTTLQKQRWMYVRSRIPYPMNILVFGRWGSGKTTLINSINTALQDEKEIDLAADLGRSFSSTENVTTKFICYSAIQATKLNLWDPWGFGEKNYSKGELPFMLDGNLSSGFCMNAVPKSGTADFNAQPTIADMMHAVLVVVSADELINESPDFFNILSKFRNFLDERGYISSLVLTKIDKLDNSLRKELKNVFNSEKIQKAIGQISESTGYNPNKIFPVRLYTNDLERNPYCEMLILNALVDAIKQGNAWIKNKVNEITKHQPKLMSFEENKQYSI